MSELIGVLAITGLLFLASVAVCVAAVVVVLAGDRRKRRKHPPMPAPWALRDGAPLASYEQQVWDAITGEGDGSSR